MAQKLKLQELSVRAHALAGYILIYSYRCNSFLLFSQENPAFNRALLTPVYYICYYNLKAYNATFVKEIYMQVYFNKRIIKPIVLIDQPTITAYVTRLSRIPPEPTSKSPLYLQYSYLEFLADFNIAFYKMPSQYICGYKKGSYRLGLKWIS